MLCARVVLGIDSIAKATTPCARRRSTPSTSLRGCRKPIRTVLRPGARPRPARACRTRTIPAQSAAASGATSWPLLEVRLLGESRRRPRAALDRQLEARGDELRDRLRGQGHPLLARR